MRLVIKGFAASGSLGLGSRVFGCDGLSDPWDLYQPATVDARNAAWPEEAWSVDIMQV